MKVSAASLTVAYAQCEMLRQIVAGAPRASASEAGWQLFGELIYTVYGQKPPQPPDTVGVPTNCLAESSQAVHDALEMTWPEFCKARGSGTHPFVEVSEETRARVVWLVDAVRRVADGVSECVAARQALDHAAGKPRKKRKPLDREWLLSELDDALDETWVSLRPFLRLPRDTPRMTAD
jgi:hypothetical protein